MSNEDIKKEKSKILLRTYVTSLLSLMLCVTMLLGTTYAWFTSEVTTAGNEISVGTLKVDLVDNENQTLAGQGGLFGSGSVKWEPGATQIETVKVVNKGDLAFDYALYLSIVGTEEPEHLLDVGEHIDVYITTHDAPARNAEELKNNWIRVGALVDVVKNGYMLANGSCTTPASVAEGDVLDTVKIALHMPKEVTDTSIMGMTVTNLGIKLMATQKMYEQDAFGGNYDANASVDVLVGTYQEFAAAVNAGKSMRLTADIAIPEDTTVVVATGRNVYIDMNGFDITGTSSEKTSNRELFLVKGKLTIKGELQKVTNAAEAAADPYTSSITYTHNAENNMMWNYMSTIFTVTADGVLNLVDVKAVNAGGTDMSFAVHMNNSGSASLYLDGAWLESPYCAIRLFNNGTGMNNVVAKESTIKSANRALWVHHYTAADFGTRYDKQAINDRLNISILDTSNTVEGMMLYGFTNAEIKVRTPAEMDVALAKAEEWQDEQITITMLRDITYVDKSITVNKADLVLNLNGHTLKGSYTAAAASAVITNNGKLTIEDETGKGQIIMVDAVEDETNGYATNTITNNGTLVVNGGKIINQIPANGTSFAIDNNVGATTTINGGYIEAKGYTVVRAYNWGHESASTINITGGEIVGYRPVWLHSTPSSAGTYPIAVNISGGTLTSTDTTYGSALYSRAEISLNRKHMTVNITGGTFNGAIALSGGNHGDATMENITITGAKINKVVDTYPAVYYYDINNAVKEYK